MTKEVAHRGTFESEQISSDSLVARGLAQAPERRSAGSSSRLPHDVDFARTTVQDVPIDTEIRRAREHMLDAIKLQGRLQSIFPQESIPRWMTSQSRDVVVLSEAEGMSMETPADALRNGRYDLVDAALEALESGVYS